MTEHEQSQQPWTDDKIIDDLQSHSWQIKSEQWLEYGHAYDFSITMRDAWQADRDALTTKLQAAEQRIAELEEEQ